VSGGVQSEDAAGTLAGAPGCLNQASGVPYHEASMVELMLEVLTTMAG
jgi:hypothetical protein